MDQAAMTKSASAISRETATLAGYMAKAIDRKLSAPVVEAAKHHILDTLAAMVSGARLPPGEHAIAYVASLGDGGEASIAGTRHKATAANAALANGMCAHADETDDSHAPSFIHPGCAIVPAALAVAEKAGANGRQFLRAVTLGYDVGTRLTKTLDPLAFHGEGRSTHSYGALFGAGAAAGALLGLDGMRARYLLSYLAQSAGGCGAYMQDSHHMQKAFVHGGRPAQSGVTAALMVAGGCTGAEDVFTGKRNFLDAYSPNPRRELLAAGLGKQFAVVETTIKKWCVGSPIQAPLDCVELLIRDHKVRADEIDGIVVEITPSSIRTVDNNAMDDINLQHLLALTLVDGKLTFKSCHDPRRTKDKRVRELRRKVQLKPTKSLLDSRVGRQAIVSIRTRDGRKLTQRINSARGNPSNPMSRQEVIVKARDLMDDILKPIRSKKVVEAVMEIEALKDVRRLGSLLRLGKGA
jgi:2-methylcitrate dehydratase PrpD